MRLLRVVTEHVAVLCVRLFVFDAELRMSESRQSRLARRCSALRLRHWSRRSHRLLSRRQYN